MWSRVRWHADRLRSEAGRARRDRYFRSVARRGTESRYLFVSGPGGDGRRYRCDHPAEALALAGVGADVGYHAELDLEALAPRYEAIVLYRVPWDERVEALLDAAGRAGTRVLADTDDLVFDRSHVALVDAYRAVAPAARAEAEDAFERLGRTLEAVERVVVSTEPLREALEGRAASVALAPNVVNRSFVRRLRPAREAHRRRNGIVVGYVSGTPTHDRDFLEAADALVELLEQEERVRLRIVGFLRLDARFERFGRRVERASYQPWRRLPRILADLDVSIAPLERGNAFTAAKSCLKYLEASSAALPTVASAAPDFARVIRHGDNGFLAEGPETWLAALTELVRSPERRRVVGDRAFADVLERHTTAARAAATAEAFRAVG